jgi:two-component system, NarL family, response regulator NreC
MKKVSLVVADDHSIIRKAIVHLLTKTDFEIIGEMNNGIELLAFVRKTVPDFAIIDLEMPKMDGYEAISKLRKKFSSIKLIAFSGFLDSHNQKQAIKMGADATVSKGDTVTTLLKALKAVQQGKNYHSDVSSIFSAKPLDDKKDTLLTLREKQILTMIANGKTSKQIGESYYISQWTVNKHRANIREKLGRNNISGIVKYAIENGYIEN